MVVFNVIWQEGEIIAPPKPVELSSSAAKNVLRVAKKQQYPKWIEEKELPKYGYDVKVLGNKDTKPKKNLTPKSTQVNTTATKEVEGKEPDFKIKSVEEMDNQN